MLAMKIARSATVGKPEPPADYEALIRVIHDRYATMSKGIS